MMSFESQQAVLSRMSVATKSGILAPRSPVHMGTVGVQAVLAFENAKERVGEARKIAGTAIDPLADEKSPRMSEAGIPKTKDPNDPSVRKATVAALAKGAPPRVNPAAVEKAVMQTDEKDKSEAKKDKDAPPERLKKLEASALKSEIQMDDHIISAAQLLQKYGTSLDTGLTAAVAAQRLEEFGLNQLTPKKETPAWIKFLKQLVTGFALLLWVGSLLCLISYGLDASDQSNLYLAIALILTILLTGAFAFFQEQKSSNVMAGFKNLLPQQCRVIRDGQKMDLAANQLVPGDVVEVIAGNRIPADMRVLECSSMTVDNSSLTGESEAQSRSPECTHDNPLETKNLAFCGTTCANGQGKGVIILTGDATLIGRIAGLASGTEVLNTPIQREINRFVLVISCIACTIGVIFFGIGFKLYGPLQNVVLMIGIIVANVPEGLIATVTVCLTHAARRMAANNVLVKNLQAVETLGSTSVICSDKTGTLTQNRMTVQHCYYDLTVAAVNETVQTNDKTATGTTFPLVEARNESFKALHKISALCNRATFDPATLHKPIQERDCFGDATESGLIKYAESVQSVEAMRVQFPKIVEIPFNSTNKYQLSIHAHAQQGTTELQLVMKGAPERIIDRCATILIQGKEQPLTPEIKQQLNEANETLGSRGERVLGFCHLYLDPKQYPEDYEFNLDQLNFPVEKLCFVGLISLIDPPRPSVPGAVAKCHTAGIKVVMVTGDHPITAKAIAKQVGIIKSETIEDVAKRMGVKPAQVNQPVDAIVVAGEQIKGFVKEDWDRVLGHKEIVFARTSPQQKLLIVEANQDRGYIVAVTGDGVNDSPALKKANIGVAMGITGSDISKEAADMILLDDNFSSIVAGVEEGRLIFDNLKKSIAYTLEHLTSEVVPFLLFFVAEIPLPLTTVLILCIDLGTDLFPAISCAYEEAESDIMSRPPRNPNKDKLVGWRLFFFAYLQIGLIQVSGVMFTYFYVFRRLGYPASMLVGSGKDWKDDTITGPEFDFTTSAQRDADTKTVQTAVFLAIVIVQWGGLLVCKTRKLSLFQQGLRNKAINYSLIAETLIAIFLIYCPGVCDVTGTDRFFPGEFWWPPMPFSLLVIVYDEVRKYIIRHNPGGLVERLTYY